jgi:hypothetical protein
MGSGNIDGQMRRDSEGEWDLARRYKLLIILIFMDPCDIWIYMGTVIVCSSNALEEGGLDWLFEDGSMGRRGFDHTSRGGFVVHSLYFGGSIVICDG